MSVEVIKADLSKVELEILEYLGRRAKHNDKPEPTQYIAWHIDLGTDQVLRYLIRLEKRGKVTRTGQRGGWTLA